MSHRSVEIVIGKLATDEGFRRRFVEDPAGALDELRSRGCELSALEAQVLGGIDPEAVRAFAEALDRRLQKVDLASGSHNRKGD